MPRVLLAVTGNFGLAPQAAEVAAALLEHGHEVVVLTAPGEADRFVRLGLEVETVPEPAMPALSRLLPPLAARARQGFQRADQLLLGPAAAQWSAVQHVLHRRAIDVVLADGFHLGAGLLGHLPRTERPALIGLGHFPVVAPDPQVAPYGLGLPPDRGSVNPVRTALLELGVARSSARLSRRYRVLVRRLTGVHVPGDMRAELYRGDAWAQLTAPRFEYPRTALPAGFRFVGSLPPDDPGTAPAWLDPDAPLLVVLTEGAPAADDLVGPVIAASVGSGIAVLVVDPAMERRAALPPTVHVERAAPWHALRPGSTVVLTAGDYLQVHHGLRHGIPVIAAGTFETQVETAARLRWSGAGIDLGTSRPSARQVRAAVEQALGDGAMRQAAARIAAQLARLDPLTALLDLVQELVGDRTR